jgi:uncharacterized membrane protein
MEDNLKKKILISAFFVLVAFLARFIPFKIPNIEFISSAIAILTLFFGFRVALPMILATVFLTDLIKSGPPQIWEIVVISGWATVALTHRLLKGKKLLNILIMEIAGTASFFLVTNSLVFFMFNFYPKTAQGYFACLIAGLPFARNQLIGNTIFSVITYKTVALEQNLVKEKLLSTVNKSE